jgi:hypothetical protein
MNKGDDEGIARGESAYARQPWLLFNVREDKIITGE